MSGLLNYLRGLLGGSDDEQDGLEALQALLADRETTLRLTAQYGRPTVDGQGETTAIFPTTLYHDGEEYGKHYKEFALPDNGLQDSDEPLTRFLNSHGISSIEELGDIQGMTDEARLTEGGDIVVGNNE